MSDIHHFERTWWGNCCNTYGEETKQYVYANLMEIKRAYNSFVLPNISVLDIGGGPVSMMLKCSGLKRGLVVDPINYPQWTKDRYKLANIDVKVQSGEDVTETGFDEVWIYNCLQHTIDPEKLSRMPGQQHLSYASLNGLISQHTKVTHKNSRKIN